MQKKIMQDYILQSGGKRMSKCDRGQMSVKWKDLHRVEWNVDFGSIFLHLGTCFIHCQQLTEGSRGLE